MKAFRRLRTALINSLSDELYLRIAYRRHTGRRLHLNPPVLFSEKMQWLKLHDRKEIYHTMVDKAEAKRFIAEHVGEQYVIPTLGVWERFEDIDFDLLPERFIIKCTHDSGSYYICRDKKWLDKEAVRSRLMENFNLDYYYKGGREWPYKGLKPRIIAEPLLANRNGKELTDYKFFCLTGVPVMMHTMTERNSGHAYNDVFDMEGKLIEVNQQGYTNNPTTPALPCCFREMQELARALARDTYQLRVDFYEVDNRAYVGELTFFDSSGFAPFTPERYERLYGDLIKLPTDSI